jgi:hypothetical protein
MHQEAEVVIRQEALEEMGITAAEAQGAATHRPAPKAMAEDE